MLFDTHAHYDDEQFDADRRELLSGLGDRGVGLVLNPASNRASAEKIMTYLHDYPFLYAAVGTHPHDAEEMKDEDLARFAALFGKELYIFIYKSILDIIIFKHGIDRIFA